jgi:heme/copper-type cytochrome/quinol oxidase subunit 2
MRSIRTFAQAVTAAVTLAVVALVGATTASAQPAPIEPDRTPPATTSSGFDLWPTVALVIVAVLLVVATAFAITVAVTSRRRQERRPAPA